MESNGDVSAAQPDKTKSDSSFFSEVLSPGSSFHPTFLLILDVAFTSLLCVFLGLLFLTHGNAHIIVLIGIEGCLWASVKWFVHELRTAERQNNSAAPVSTDAQKSKND